MERWNSKLRKFVESPLDIEFFLDEIVNVCKKHGMSLGHEDGHGSFLIDTFSEHYVDWLRVAQDCRGEYDDNDK